MPKCGFCGTTIVIGGVRSGDQRFCNGKCQHNAHIVKLGNLVPTDLLEARMQEVFRGNCPKCQGRGPVDVHNFYEVFSLVFATRWSTSQRLSCRSCGVKRQLGALVFTLCFGWWGFPSGLILTPIQAVRNIVAMCGGPDPSHPSAALKKLVLIDLGQKLAAAQQQTVAQRQTNGGAAPKPPELVRLRN